MALPAGRPARQRTARGNGFLSVAALGVVFCSALAWRGLAIGGDPLVWGTGSSAALVTNLPPQATNLVAISAGRDFMLGLRADGGVIAWGTSGFGQTNVPASATNVVAIAAGHQHALALRANGTIVAWGNQASGATNVPVERRAYSS